MEWYIPLTLLPSLGLILMSTSSQMMALSSEINGLFKDQMDDLFEDIITRKIHQLKRLSTSLTLLYAASAFYVMSGLVGFIGINNISTLLPRAFLLIGTIITFTALALLTIYAQIAVKIREEQFQLCKKRN